MSTSASQWIDRYARAVGIDPPDEEQTTQLLALAAAAAHASERTAAPVSTWIAARAGLSTGEALSIAQDLADTLEAGGPGP